MKAIIFALLASLTLLPTFVLASPETEEFSKCMVESLNGKERKLLAKWIFFGMSTHPDIKQFSAVTPEDRTETEKSVGNLVTRLIGDDCGKQAIAAVKVDGDKATPAAFRVVGEVAMRELMMDKTVMNAFTNYTNYIDYKKLEPIFRAK